MTIVVGAVPATPRARSNDKEACMVIGNDIQFVLRFEDVEDASPSLLGGKGAHLCEMARLGLPVPPGFVITTEACRQYRQDRQFPDGLWDQVVASLQALEERTGRRFNDPEAPLVVSVRSGAPISMPGMMDTILNLGLNHATTAALGREMGDARPALDSHRRFLQSYGSVVLGVPGDAFERILDIHRDKAGVNFDFELQPQSLNQIIAEFTTLTEGRIPTAPWEQLQHAVEAVFASWDNPRAVHYRDYYGIDGDMGTAAVVMRMVYGNLGPDSGTGVLFSRNPATGESVLFGEYLPNAQGEDVVAGVRTPTRLDQLQATQPDVHAELYRVAQQLERHYRDVQDVEFTVERSQLYMLQTRTAKRSVGASVRIAVEMVNEGLISKEEALQRVDPRELPTILLPQFETEALRRADEGGAQIAKGLAASPGAATGRIALDPDRAVAAAAQGQRVILVRNETSADDIHGIIKAEGVLTCRGGLTSHAAVVTRGMGKPCVVGAEEIQVDMENRTVTAGGKVLEEGDTISLNGSRGRVYIGRIKTIAPSLDNLNEMTTLLGWADDARTLQVWANADTPNDAERAREFGAEGIGLCRTEHMFFAAERLPHMRQVLLNAGEAQELTGRRQNLEKQVAEAPLARRAQAQEQLDSFQAGFPTSPAVRRFREGIERLEEFQREDFTGILRAMRGLPVVIRLLDAPLHEFLPTAEEIPDFVETISRGADDDLDEAQVLTLVQRTREANPMLGHRGCRLGITFPEIYEMQVRAILRAAAGLASEGVAVHPEIMIPLASHVNELAHLRALVDRVKDEVEQAGGPRVNVKYGSMIEVPRAALTAAELAQEAEFFSFGSNDLTQMGFGYSRDDAEGKFLNTYLDMGILPTNPFNTLDISGIGQLVRMAAENGRAVRPDIGLGICGEHGGDPASIFFCHKIGLDYVSASPMRVPGARLAAAQAAIQQP